MSQFPFKKILTEPLLHFILIALLFFVLYELINPNVADDSKIITISDNRIEQLKKGFEKTWTRKPTKQELDKIIESYALDEIYAREAKALGLGENDEVIRRRLRQKMEFILQDMSVLQQPSTEELNSYYQRNIDNYKQDNQYSFEQVYIMDSRPKNQLAELLTQQKQRILLGKVPQGDTSMLPTTLDNKYSHQINRQFGIGFNAALDEAPFNQWVGPIKSGLGLHFIKVSQRNTGTASALSEIKDRVIKDWRYQQNKIFIANYQMSLLKQYQLNIENNNVVSNATLSTTR
ncbi:peptidyl-prolyl cis-trans isomerase [Colwellia sp. 12G3]|uniref:peptidylprolyl isomerase n=1 Tax=Colwellia sp. 12G3 TaxID=2058299 RepID=UPI000C331F3F|nr:peptidylprolyl isomerase [Colwellia sp. 12G3]PKI18213.1 peptidyl-prolyl cis-trans isomerase [Colwellia sp. 12G3]